MSQHRTARLALGSVALAVVLSAGACGPSAVCTSSEDCAAFGKGSVCVLGEGDEGLCTDGDLDGSRGDGGPNDGGDDPGALGIHVQLSPASVRAGESVHLEWRATAAVSCSATLKARHEPTSRSVPGASTEAEGSVDVTVTQDTTFTVTCVGANSVSDSRSKVVDVEVDGSLWATSESVDIGGSVELHWETFGAERCHVQDDEGQSVYSIPSSEMISGSTTAPAGSLRYALYCDGVQVDEQPVSILAIRDLVAEPSALGPTPQRVTLTWRYEREGGGCQVFLNGSSSSTADRDPSTPGHQLDLDGTTTALVRCDGHSGVLPPVSVEIPRLIHQFSVEGGPVAYEADATVTIDKAPGASCVLSDEDGVVDTSPIVPNVTSSMELRLDCEADGKSASALTELQVLPARPSITGELASGPENVKITVETSPNALSCTLERSPGADIAMTPGTIVGGVKRFTASVATSVEGAHSFGARCFADDARTLASATATEQRLRVYVGHITAGALSTVAHLVVGDIRLSSGPTSLLATDLRELSGSLVLQNNSEISTASFPNLLTIGQDLRVENNSNLDVLSLPALRSVGGSLTLKSLPELNDDVSGLAFDALTTVGGEFLVESTPLRLLRVYFPALEAVGGAFKILFNANLSCVEAGDLYEALTSSNGVAISNNAGGCSWT